MNLVIPQHGSHNSASQSGEIELVSRLAVVIQGAKLDCECRSRLNDTLERFMALERRRIVRRNLFEARSQRDRIEAFLVFLKELDDVEAAEPDHSVYKEIALLFDDIAQAARQGAELMRQVSPPLSA